VREAVRSGALASAHDIAEGGLLVALAESCLAGGLGATVTLPTAGTDADLFGEAPGRAFIVSGPEETLRAALPGARVIGHAGGDVLGLSAGDVRVQAALSELRAAWDGGLVKFA